MARPTKSVQTTTNISAWLKVQKVLHYTEAAEDEIKLLQEAHKQDPQARRMLSLSWTVLSLLGPNGKHMCMALKFDRNLLDIIKEYDNQGIPLDLLQAISLRDILRFFTRNVRSFSIQTGE